MNIYIISETNFAEVITSFQRGGRASNSITTKHTRFDLLYFYKTSQEQQTSEFEKNPDDERPKFWSLRRWKWERVQ